MFPFCSESCQKGTAQQNEIQIITQQSDTVNKQRNNATGNSNSSTMKFEIIFENSAGNASAKVAKLKYNKTSWASIEWDDNSLSALQGYNIIKNKFYTDGCNNKIQYAGSIAVNGRNQFDNSEIGANNTGVTYAQLKELINAGWDVENHSYYHGPDGNYNFGSDWLKNIKTLDDLIQERIQYKMNGAVVPTNYDGFPTAAKNFGYLFSTSQGTFDDFEPAGKPTFKEYFDFDLAPLNFSSFNRIFYDDWNQLEKSVKNSISEIATRNNHYFRFASHGIDEAALKRILDYFELMSNDRFLFIPTREIMEYRIVAGQPIKYEQEGNKLIIEIDGSAIPDRFRWRDLSFVVTSGSKITSVNVISGIDKTSFNANTGLVNIFKQRSSW